MKRETHFLLNFRRSVVIPKLSPDLCRINIIKINDPDGAAANGFVYEVVPFMQAELRLKSKEEFFLSNILIFDLRNYSLKNLLKYTPSINNQLVNIMVSTKKLIEISTRLGLHGHLLNGCWFSNKQINLVCLFCVKCSKAIIHKY